MTERVEVAFGAQLDEISAAINQLNSKFEQFSKDASSRFSEVGLSTDKLLGKIKSLAAGFLSLATIREAVNDTVRLGREAINLSTQLGISAAEASQLAVALGDVYSSTEEYQRANQFLVRQLRSNEERLNELGVATRDTNGDLLNQTQIFFNATKALDAYKVGTDRNAASVELFGRGAQQMQELMKLTPEALEAARKKADELGLTLTVRGVAAVQEYRAAMNDLGDVYQAIKKVIGEALMPILSSLANWLSSIGPDAVRGFSVAVRILSGLVWGLVFAFRTVAEIVVAAIQGMTAGIAMVSDMMQAAIRLDWDGVKAAWAAGTETVGEIGSGLFDRITENARKTKEELQNLWEPGTAAAGQQGGGGERKFTETGRFDKWKAELEAMRADIMAKEGELRDLSKEQEVAFWQAKLAVTYRGSAEYRQVFGALVAARRGLAQEDAERVMTEFGQRLAIAQKDKAEQIRIAEERVAYVKLLYGEDSKQFRDAEWEKVQIMREAHEEQLRIAQITREKMRDLRLGELSIAREQLRFETEMGERTAAERLRMERELIQREYEIRRDALRQQLEMGDLTLAEKSQINAQLETMDQDLQLKLRENANNTIIAIRDQWVEMLGAISSAFATSIKGIILGTTTWRQAMSNIFQAILGEFIALGVKLLVRWVATQIAMTAATQAQNAIRTTADTVQAVTAITTAKVVAMSEIAAFAAVAGAAATASAAAIPFYGWAIAPAAGASVYASAMAYQPLAMLSAEGGLWEVPADTLANIHKREMVIPEREAEGLRALVESGGAAMPPIQIYAIDARGVRDLFMREGGALMSALKSQVRDFNRG